MLIVIASFCFSQGATRADDTTAKHPNPAATPKVAPADEYFGKLKMSILGIANTIKDQSLRYDREPEQLASELNSINFVVDAIHDWEHKYPHDPWIAKSLFFLERFYTKIPNDEGRAHAKSTFEWLVHDFPSTSYGKTAKEELRDGKVGAPLTPTVVQSGPPSVDVTRPVSSGQ